MAVRLERFQVQRDYPDSPRFLVWWALLPLVLLTGLGLTVLFGRESLADEPERFWLIGGLLPLLLWLLFASFGYLVYQLRLLYVDTWNETVATERAKAVQRGRRSLTVLAVNWHSGLREAGVEDGQAQWRALAGGEVALKAQPGWREAVGAARHSRLQQQPLEVQEQLIARVLRQLASELAAALESIPSGTRLAVLFEGHSRLPEEALDSLWQQAWSDAGIDLPTRRLERKGLDALDDWLDRQHASPDLLLVVAMQVDPERLDGSAEAAVALLLGNPSNESPLPALARLHRPEQERQVTTEALTYALSQALEWGSLPPKAVAQAWFASVPVKRRASLTAAMANLEFPVRPGQGIHDLDTILGCAGCVGPWLAIATATQAVQAEGGPQFIVSGEAPAGVTTLWGLLVTAAGR